MQPAFSGKHRTLFSFPIFTDFYRHLITEITEVHYTHVTLSAIVAAVKYFLNVPVCTFSATYLLVVLALCSAVTCNVVIHVKLFYLEDPPYRWIQVRTGNPPPPYMFIS